MGKPKEICGISRRVLYDTLLPLAIVGVVVAIAFYIIRAPEAYRLIDQYAVLRDLLLILLAAVTVSAWFVWRMVRNETIKAVRADIEKNFSRMGGKLAISMGLNY